MKKDKFTGLLTLDQLKSLVAGGLNEADRKSRLFDEALLFYAETVKEGKRRGRYDPVQEAVNALTSEFLREHTPPVKYIGRGLGRMAFASTDGRVCKFAVDSAGIGQNKLEIDTLKAYRDWPCFIKMYECDDMEYFGLEVEACAIVGDDYATANRILSEIGSFGINLDDMLYQIMYVCKKLPIYDFDVERTAESFHGEPYDRILNLIDNIVQARTPQAKIFRNLAEYYK